MAAAADGCCCWWLLLLMAAAADGCCWWLLLMVAAADGCCCWVGLQMQLPKLLLHLPTGVVECTCNDGQERGINVVVLPLLSQSNGDDTLVHCMCKTNAADGCCCWWLLLKCVWQFQWLPQLGKASPFFGLVC
jgi:hypothetical protein